MIEQRTSIDSQVEAAHHAARTSIGQWIVIGLIAGAFIGLAITAVKNGWIDLHPVDKASALPWQHETGVFSKPAHREGGREF